MTLVLQDTPPIASNLPPTSTGRKRWTLPECEYMERAGLLNGRYELLDGEIISKMGKSGAHSFSVMRVISYLLPIFTAYRVQSHSTLEPAPNDQLTNCPQPTIVALRKDLPYNPNGEDALLVVEVCDNTQQDDLGFKVGLYARAGVLQYWILDINRRVLIDFRNAQNGDWQEQFKYTENKQVAPISAPNAFVQVSELLPPLIVKESAE